LRIWEFIETEQGSLASPDDSFEGTDRERAVALGYFDGVHAGHRILLEKLCYLARKRNLTASVHTFSSLPKSKNGNGEGESLLLTTLSERYHFFERIGLDEAVVFPFSPAVSDISAEDFLNIWLRDTLHARVVVAGEDYRFGKDRSGDISLLRKWGEENHIEVVSITPLSYKGQIISSSWIRDCMRDGKIQTANALLGYPVSYRGNVGEGKKLGRTLGFPTANIECEAGKLLPAFGVYASVLYANARCYPAVTNIGFRPTVNPEDDKPMIETTILDQQVDLYGQHIRVFLFSYIRPEKRFDSVAELREQVHKDMAEVRHYHEVHANDYSILLAGVI